jgi:hypothetical protein
MQVTAGIFPDDVLELNGVSPSLHVTKARENSVCLACRSAKLLCGKSSCPILLKARIFTKLKAKLDTAEIVGDSPPSAFVGSFGYPRVSFGPMIPPVEGETSIFDAPERWLRSSFDEIVEYRSLLVRGKERANVDDARDPHGLLEQLQTSLLSTRPVASHMLLTKPPCPVLSLNEDSPPFGPSGALLRYSSSPGSSDRGVERAHYDRDLKAVDAVCQLYEGGLPVSRIQKAFSVGMFGVAKNRKLVPTRWSITAVDSNLSLRLLERIKGFPTLDEYRVFSYDHLNNRYFVMMIPASYSYEWIEAWFPNTVWNQGGSSPEVLGDFEPFRGRTTYAAPGGCYYTVRLATAEYLTSQRRQATVLGLREIYPGYILPLGVWTVREAIRAAMNSQPTVFDNFGAAFGHILSGFKIRREHWIHASTVVKEMLHQRRISDFP